MLAPRAVVVSRRTELEELIDRHGTRGQVEFFLRSRGRDLGSVQAQHDATLDALHYASNAIPEGWRRGDVERADLHRFLFSPEDVVVVVGQDGLVANVAKYLDGQLVVGVDPDPERNPGVLVRHTPAGLHDVLADVGANAQSVERRTMVRATLDDGQSLLALNEIFVGHPSHQSARYRLTQPAAERQSSSGLVVGTGTGATGWCASISRERGEHGELPSPESPMLVWFVREAWPSPATGTTLTQGLIRRGEVLGLAVESDELVVFGDGIEADHLAASWGQEIRVGLATERLHLVVPVATLP